ncbi:hypothetical protein EDC64_112129 [Aquabacter spiritensis]|uniref:Uncharacterized protein n=1 Tax=Aquabacter spiritensis TaxID=933073 RepID=A0A4R3LQH3_9HYPH|nr:hypothetical protein EDC64_112129 [Aquabacter spiritensis]
MPNMMPRRGAPIGAVTLCLLLSGLGGGPAAAQQIGPAGSGCTTTPPKAAPTPLAQGPASGTEPGAAGSTAWSGGTGGSYIGTTPGSATPASPNSQPPTVQGVSPSVVGPTTGAGC